MTNKIRTKNFIVEIDTDNDPWNPRTFGDNLGSMNTFHNRYAIGDKHNFTPESLLEHVRRADVVSLPIYAYEHGQITIATSPFSCRFDSGQIGFIHASHSDIAKWYGMKTITPEIIEEATKTLQHEIAEYDYYMNGEHYRVAVFEKKYNADTNEIETDCVHSCGGFMEINDAYDDAIGYVDEETENAIRSQLNA